MINRCSKHNKRFCACGSCLIEMKKETAKEIFKELEDWFKKAQDKYEKLSKKEKDLMILAQYNAILQHIYGFSIEFKEIKKKHRVK